MNKPGYTILRTLVLFITSSILFLSCDIKKNKKETDPKLSFIKIFENNGFTEELIPIDVQQCDDGGYVILAKKRIATSSFYGVYILKTDALGNPLSEQTLTDDFVNPIYNLMKVGSTFYFFAMNTITLDSRLISIDQNGTATEVATVTGVIYPLYVSLDETSGQFLLQHYNRDDKQSVVSRINTSGTVTAQREFAIGFGDFDVEEPIIDHMTGNGKALPFLTGTVNGSYFFNGFYNYTLSVVFFNFNTAAPGLLQGYKDERCVSSLMYLPGNNTFALSRYAYGDNYIAPNATVNYNSGAIASSSNINGNLMLEFTPDAKVVLKRLNINGRSVLAYLTETKAKQISLYMYDESSGSLIKVKYFGYSNPYEAGNLVATSDGGIALVGTTYLAGRFPRIVLFKVPAEELE